MAVSGQGKSGSTEDKAQTFPLLRGTLEIHRHGARRNKTESCTRKV